MTLRAIGPAVSCFDEIGMIPAPLTSPSLGLIPTMPFALAGHTIEPYSRCRPPRRRGSRGDHDPEPELEPQGLRSSDVGRVVLAADAAPAARRGDRSEIRPLRQVCLADDDRAGVSQRCDEVRVGGALPARARDPAGGRHAGRVDVVLHHDRDAEQRSVVATPRASSAARASARAVGAGR